MWVALYTALLPGMAKAQILGANFNELPKNVDPVLLDDSRTTWVRGFFEMLDLAGQANLATNSNVLGMQRAADAGRELVVSFKWNFDGAGQSVPAPGSLQEQQLFDLAVDTLNAIDRPVNTIVLGNEPMWETPTADLQRPAPGQRSPLANFTERLLDHVDATYSEQQPARPKYFLGALNRLDQPANQQKDVVQDFFDMARTNPKIAGMDLHVHYNGIAQ
ncbi:MAG: hypothetical protein KDA37_07655, partial [Planctomycetales bacterium]|nr:hypothetical protein [Planctomycetales bacterium]